MAGPEGHPFPEWLLRVECGGGLGRARGLPLRAGAVVAVGRLMERERRILRRMEAPEISGQRQLLRASSLP